MLPFVNARASVLPLTAAEIQAASKEMSLGPVCVARVQRRLGIGWNRAADLVLHIAGFDALPPVAKRLFANGAGAR